MAGRVVGGIAVERCTGTTGLVGVGRLACCGRTVEGRSAELLEAKIDHQRAHTLPTQYEDCPRLTT